MRARVIVYAATRDSSETRRRHWISAGGGWVASTDTNKCPPIDAAPDAKYYVLFTERPVHRVLWLTPLPHTETFDRHSNAMRTVMQQEGPLHEMLQVFLDYERML